MSRKSPNAKPRSVKPEERKSVVPFVIIGVVLVAVIGAVVMMSRRSADVPNTPPQNTPNSTASATPSAPRQTAAGAANPYTRGGQNAPVTLEEFSDFQCPACGNLEPGLRKVVKDRSEERRVG